MSCGCLSLKHMTLCSCKTAQARCLGTKKHGSLSLLQLPPMMHVAKSASMLQVACVMLGDPVPHRLHWPKYSEFSVNNHRMPVYRRNANQAAGENVRDEAVNIEAHVYPGRVYVSLRCRDSRRCSLRCLWQP